MTETEPLEQLPISVLASMLLDGLNGPHPDVDVAADALLTAYPRPSVGDLAAAREYRLSVVEGYIDWAKQNEDEYRLHLERRRLEMEALDVAERRLRALLAARGIDPESEAPRYEAHEPPPRPERAPTD